MRLLMMGGCSFFCPSLLSRFPPSHLSRSLLDEKRMRRAFITINADDRIILETDAAAIASRVSRPRADTTDIVINEQTVRDACKSSYLNVRLRAATEVIMN
jgi:hypothetical protein